MWVCIGPVSAMTPGNGPDTGNAMKRAAMAAPINRSPDRLSGGVHQILELGRSRFLVDLLNGCEFAGQTLEGGLIHLAL